MVNKRGASAPTKRSQAKGRSGSEQFGTAKRRILEAQESDSLSLDLSELNLLKSLPEEISSLVGLQTISLDYTKIRDLTPIAKLTNLRSLSLIGTEVDDLIPITKLTSLQSLIIIGGSVNDISPLSGLTQLVELSVSLTKVSDLAPLAGLTALRRLWCNRTPVADLTPLAQLKSLQLLGLENTRTVDLSPLRGLPLQSLSIAHAPVEDLGPIAETTSLAEAAGPGIDLGLSFQGAAIAGIPPFNRYAELAQPYRTVEAFNEVRRQHGLPDYVPTKYEYSANLDGSRDNNEEDDHEQLAQKPASHSFALRHGRIEAQAQIFPPRYPEVADDIRNEVGEKAKEALDRLTNCNAPRRLISTVDRLGSSLGHSLTDMRAGVLQMRFRSLEADIAAYDTEDGRKELPEDAFAMLRDLISSLEDLMGCFPQLTEIEAERLAQRLKDTDVPGIINALAQIRKVAEESDAVASSAVEALKVGEPELEHDNEIIDGFASEAIRIAAINARDRTVGYMLLVYRNFVAGAVKAGNELAGLGADTWKGVRKKAPEQLSDAVIASTIAMLVGALLGPTAAMGAFAISFKPLRDRAKRTADKLIALTRKRGGDAADKIDE